MLHDVTNLASSTLLPVEEVNIWINHLQTVTENRKKGSKKASRTRRAKQHIENDSECSVPNTYHCENEDNHCGMCGILYEEETDEIEQWIACDKCSIWYHWKYDRTTILCMQ